jgi:hypothetical protein
MNTGASSEFQYVIIITTAGKNKQTGSVIIMLRKHLLDGTVTTSSRQTA